jgi:hypothetical protein
MRAWQACNGDLNGMVRRPCLRYVLPSWGLCSFLVPSWHMLVDGRMDGWEDTDHVSRDFAMDFG